MAKPKLTDFKRFLAAMTEEELRAEMLKLFSKLDQVQAFYAQELMSDSDRKSILEAYKKKVFDQYWTRGGNPRNGNNAAARKTIGEFEKIAVFPVEVIDLLLSHAEVITDKASQFGGGPDADYNAAVTSFEKAMKLMETNKLNAHFEQRCLQLFKADNLDYWHIENLEETYYSYFPR
jgi:Family of unknown function (DUF6155)